MLWIVVDDAGLDLDDNRADEIVWTKTTNGEYSARSAYQLQFQGSVISDFQSLTWKVWAPSRFRFFIWLILQNQVWTADRLMQCQWSNDYFCQHCIRNLETITYLMMECPYTRSVWSSISDRTSLPRLHQVAGKETSHTVEL
jgi:hypothetical protein